MGYLESMLITAKSSFVFCVEIRTLYANKTERAISHSENDKNKQGRLFVTLDGVLPWCPTGDTDVFLENTGLWKTPRSVTVRRGEAVVLNLRTGHGPKDTP